MHTYPILWSYIGTRLSTLCTTNYFSTTETRTILTADSHSASGLYFFTWSSVVATRKIFNAEILVNGQRKGLGNCNNEGKPGYENCANTLPLVLNTEDEVNILMTIANYLHRDWSSFKDRKFNYIIKFISIFSLYLVKISNFVW